VKMRTIGVPLCNKFPILERQIIVNSSNPLIFQRSQTFFWHGACHDSKVLVRSKVSDDKGTSILHVVNRRAESRILVHVPVEVTEIDEQGQTFTDRTFIEDVSDFGCRFTTRGPVKQEDTVAVKILGKYGNSLSEEAPRLYEIMWVAPQDHGFTVGARLLQGEKLANTKFPAGNGGQKHDPK
jgi:PilZ domain